MDRNRKWKSISSRWMNVDRKQDYRIERYYNINNRLMIINRNNNIMMNR